MYRRRKKKTTSRCTLPATRKTKIKVLKKYKQIDLDGSKIRYKNNNEKKLLLEELID